MSGADQACDLGLQLLRAATDGASAHLGDDAEGEPGHVAAVLDLQEGAGVPRELRDACRDPARLGVHVVTQLAQEVDRTLGLAVPEHPVDARQLAQDLGLGHREAARDRDPRPRGLASDAADQLARLAPRLGRDRAGVDDDELGLAVLLLEAAPHEGLAQDLRVVLVGLAAVGDEADGAHGRRVSTAWPPRGGCVRIAAPGWGRAMLRPYAERSAPRPTTPPCWINERLHSPLAGAGLLLGLLASCGGGADVPDPSSKGEAAPAPPALPARSSDPRVAEAREALGGGTPPRRRLSSLQRSASRRSRRPAC